MVSKSVASLMLVLRIFALAASVATIALVVTNNVKFFDGSGTKFHQIIAFRYVLAVAATAAAYGLVQLPFALYYAVKQKRLIRNGCFPDFDFFADKLISLVLATGVGAGFGVSYKFEKTLEAAGVPKNDKTITDTKFWDRGIIASAVLTVALISMAAVSVISSINRSRSKGMFA